MMMPGRKYSSGDGYRYGFNGKEQDSEVKGTGSQYDYGFRIYDPRISRFLSVDPLTKEYPWYTPYQFAGNKPIWAVDLDGLEEWETNDGNKANGPLDPQYAKAVGLKPTGQGGSTSSDKKVLPTLLGDMKLHEPWENQRKFIWNFTEQINGKTYDVTATLNLSDEGVGEASGASSLIPIYGSGRNAINDFQNGRYIGGTINGILAISDVLLVKSAIQGAAKGGFKAMTLGNKPWHAPPGQESYRALYLKSGFAKPGEPVHHWLIHQNSPLGKNVPDALKNQMFNLKPFASQSEHMVYGHGRNYLSKSGASTLGQFWHGTPTWPKLFTLSYGGRGLQFMFGNGSSNSNASNQ